MTPINPSIAPIRLASRIERLTGSVARDILAYAQKRSIVSFAGGLPDPAVWEGFSLPTASPDLLQYGASEGEARLRRRFAERLAELGLPNLEQQIIVTNGSQQGLDLVSKLLVESGTPVMVESPTYLAALQCFQLFGASFTNVPFGEYGFVGEAFSRMLDAAQPAFAYLTPTFQNPSGRCYSEDERNDIAERLDAHGSTILVEDDPYRELHYGAPPPAPIAARLRRAPFIYLSSASKTLAPALRIGCLAASPGLSPLLLKLKQAADLHTNRLAQSMVEGLLADRDRFETHLGRCRDVYRAKRDAMARLLDRNFTGLATWEIPAGGMFFWLRLKQPTDLKAALARSLENGIAFMPGDPFFADGQAIGRHVRLNFTQPSLDDMERCLPLLARFLVSERG